MNSLRRTFRTLCLALAPVILIAAAVIGMAPAGVGASSHREAPLIAKDPSADNTDVYAFVSPDAPTTATLIANWIPFEEPGGGPNFYHFDDNARYNIKIDRDGDGVPDITYEWALPHGDQKTHLHSCTTPTRSPARKAQLARARRLTTRNTTPSPRSWATAIPAHARCCLATN